VFSHIKAGDVVTRMLAGTVPMQLRVTEVDEELIYCGTPGQGWSFDRQTGAEVDDDLGWGPAYGITGSFLTLSEESSDA